MIPSSLMMIFNLLIYIYVRTSSRRIYPIGTNGNNPIIQNTRDIYLVKHMLFIFVVFVVGWSPAFILALPGLAITSNSSWINIIVAILPVISSTIIGLDFAYFNHDIRQYLKRKSLVCLHLI